MSYGIRYSPVQSPSASSAFRSSTPLSWSYSGFIRREDDVGPASSSMPYNSRAWSQSNGGTGVEGLRLDAFRTKSGVQHLRSQHETLIATDRKILDEAQQMRFVMEQREIEYRRRWQEPRQVIQQVRDEVRPSLGVVRENLTKAIQQINSTNQSMKSSIENLLRFDKEYDEVYGGKLASAHAFAEYTSSFHDTSMLNGSMYGRGGEYFSTGRSVFTEA
ncbi:hypothetical protein GUITHDRAFT_155229 [Guillardia theta CCMP2712]|uniref:Uncharacterized protein n=2 Tax=Guillardia theta TaxID=55529 RepID=L1IKK4_GUITC|nr:hypothetical protein GUITHDRAFT_155229 [Guillardia theta CCMP2712]EKX36459.1 hypothetical protein GUITHDRAFT_155229 [Guillardia theta CCMP2712]|mmetsp:Transcript_37814/g.119480  ORF Transcript_37814/g.119480 Transcript_37814/m.119480 type:complete len:218 (+) Transcript_37814:280-933(+)|eukprot:XP_005823439.1 hypothetical protein GUITHDRAFT_155229 [Guillardia theta CCMP2712]